VDPHHNGDFLEVLTMPIKSCSKLEQIRRKEEELQGKKSVKPKKKRARGEELLEALDQIKQTQQEQTNLLSTLVSSNLFAHYSPYIPSSVNYPSSVHHTPSPPYISSPPPSPCLDPLEDALRLFLQAYQAVPAEERPLKLKCLSQKYETSLIQEIGVGLSANKHNSLPFMENNVMPKENIEKPNHLSVENVPVKLDWNVLDFFTNSTADEAGGVLLADKDMEIWNSTIQDFLVFDD